MALSWPTVPGVHRWAPCLRPSTVFIILAARACTWANGLQPVHVTPNTTKVRPHKPNLEKLAQNDFSLHWLDDRKKKRGVQAKLKPGVRLLKIQKTASSSLGDFIIPAFCGKDYNCMSGSHLDWNEATMLGTYKGPVITMLRHPVERALSEFFYLRDNDGHSSMKQPQWDFNNKTWLKKIQDPNVSKALQIYITGYPKNPSRNRQALYILGFRDKTRDQVGLAEEMYNWDEHPLKLAKIAMGKLENLTAYGIVECWESSIRVISRALGWKEKEVVNFANNRHARGWHRMMVERKKPDYWNLKEWLGKELQPEDRWMDVVPRKVALQIERWSKVDSELYKAARQRFVEKYNLPC